MCATEYTKHPVKHTATLLEKSALFGTVFSAVNFLPCPFACHKKGVWHRYHDNYSRSYFHIFSMVY